MTFFRLFHPVRPFIARSAGCDGMGGKILKSLHNFNYRVLVPRGCFLTLVSHSCRQFDESYKSSLPHELGQVIVGLTHIVLVSLMLVVPQEKLQHCGCTRWSAYV